MPRAYSLDLRERVACFVAGGRSCRAAAAHFSALGTQLVTNVAFQWHLFKYLRPEIELNYTTWINGARNGLDQLFITFDAIIGPFPIPGTRAKPMLVVGYQRALTPSPAILNPLTPVYSRSWLLGARMFF